MQAQTKLKSKTSFLKGLNKLVKLNKAEQWEIKENRNWRRETEDKVGTEIKFFYRHKKDQKKLLKIVSNKLCKLCEMNKLLENIIYKNDIQISRTPELSNSIKEIYFILENLPTGKSSSQERFTGGSFQTVKEEITQIPQEIFLKEGFLTALITRLNKDMTKKETDRPIPLIKKNTQSKNYQSKTSDLER